MRRWFSALLVGSLGLGCEFSTDPASDPAHEVLTQQIEGGQVDVEHESVFAIMVHHSGYSSFCTATLIAPNLLLTARHCVSEGGGDQVVCGQSEFTATVPGPAVFATNDTSPNDNSSWFQGLQVRVPSEGADTCGFDVALIILANNVPATMATPAIPRIDIPVAEGESYVAIGYGDTGSVENTGGTRMIRDSLQVQCAPGDCSSNAIESTEFLGETGICSGDSGGPALDMSGKVVGVVSRGGDDCSTPIYGTVTAWRDWIMSSAVEAAALGSYSPPFWATSGTSEPPLTPDPNPPDAVSQPGGDGHACSAPTDCVTGFACYYDSDPSEAFCRASCTTNAECSGDLSCHGLGNGAGVCLHPTGDSGEASGCSISGSRNATTGGLLALGLAALLPVRRRRRRH
jgi:MYXO-CTERM domain-containing protein